MATLDSIVSVDNKTAGALAIFCRAPVLGEVKTRLAQSQGAPFALQLYRAMLRDCFDLGRALAPAVETFACFTPAEAFDKPGELFALWSGARLPQRGADLGARMLNCLADLRARGYERALIIGSDAPDLPPEILLNAFEILRAQQVVVGPSEDGGFYLIGASLALPDEIFGEIVWSRNDVWVRLRANLEAHKISFATLPMWRDVDESADLEALRARLRSETTRALATRAFLAL